MCIDNLSILNSSIFLAKGRNQFTAAIFLDIEPGYDNVLCEILIEKLLGLSLPSNILAFIQNLISSRKVFCRFDEIDEIRWVFKGLPQGSVLSLLLYNIYIADLERGCPCSCRIIQYADDIAIFTNDDNYLRSRRNLESVLGEIKIKLNLLGLSLSIEKTKFCIFDIRTRSKIVKSRYIKIDNKEIKVSNTIRFLDIIFSPKLDWNLQINHTWNKCQCPIKILSCLRHT